MSRFLHSEVLFTDSRPSDCPEIQLVVVVMLLVFQWWWLSVALLVVDFRAMVSSTTLNHVSVKLAKQSNRVVVTNRTSINSTTFKSTTNSKNSSDETSSDSIE
ncbi:hypothetical protein KIN20_027115 [Parelaphostrongylus tenuis]|uniref:Transmembrane protein n=1 Tax=Parelaphostrongylus tenuis TaxID=148309 RepID=A0AAD5QZ62_PARTN|nr:hypothetical protein KIN20_027115 [Parelaphostrongylus tenuis]